MLVANRDTNKQPGWIIPHCSDCPFDGGRQSHLSFVLFFALFFICFSPYKTRVNSPDVVAMTTLSLGAADAGKGFLQFNPPGNLPIRGCW